MINVSSKHPHKLYKIHSSIPTHKFFKKLLPLVLLRHVVTLMVLF